MKELHALVDFENVQPTLDELAKLTPGFTDVWLFHGPHQSAHAKAFANAHKRLTPVPRSGAGPNALDFHLSFYLGYVAARHPNAHMVVVANDKGYDPMLAHARLLGFSATRVGFKGKSASAAKVAPAKKAAAVKAPTPKAPGKQATAKKAAPLQAAVKKVVQMPPAKKGTCTHQGKACSSRAGRSAERGGQGARSRSKRSGQDGRQSTNQAKAFSAAHWRTARQGQHCGAD